MANLPVKTEVVFAFARAVDPGCSSLTWFDHALSVVEYDGHFPMAEVSCNF